MEKRILVALSTGEYIRKAEFLPHFLGLVKPAGTIVTTIHGQSPAKARNLAIEQAIINNCTHVFFIDDDMIPPPNTLMKLMEHNKDIVSALYLLRKYPHRPAFFDKAYDDGKCQFTKLKGSGLVKGVNCGLGAVLISIDVFKKLEQPWVRLGEVEKDGWCDDIGFFNRCRQAGFDVYCDLDSPVGHMSTVTIWPELYNGEWYSNYKHDNGNIRFPQNIV